MSRQRLRSGVLEGSTSQCPHCQGTGIIRSTESVALAVLRGLEDALMAGARTSLVATTTHSVALYILNNKRQFINDMEARHGIVIAVEASDKMQGANFTIEKGSAAPVAVRRPERSAVNMDWGFEGETPEGVEVADEPRDEEEAGREPAREAGREFVREEGREEGRRDEGGRGERGGRRRRRGRGRGDRDDAPRGDGQRGDSSRAAAGPNNNHRQPNVQGDYAPAADEGGYDGGAELALGDDAGPQGGGGDRDGARQDEQGVRRRRRGRRGGRRGRDRNRSGESFGQGQEDANGNGGAGSFAGGNGRDPLEPMSESGSRPEPEGRHEPVAEAPSSNEPVPSRETVSAAAASEHSSAAAPDADAPRARARPRRAATSSEPKIERVVVKPDQPEPIVASEQVGAAEPARRGWWQRRLSGE
jgi:ribonuclease E